jgi:hypothetical protein
MKLAFLLAAAALVREVEEPSCSTLAWPRRLESRMPYSLVWPTDLDTWPDSLDGSDPPSATAPWPNHPAEQCSLLSFELLVQFPSLVAGRGPSAYLHPFWSARPSVPLLAGLLPSGVAWQHVFEEKYRNKNSTTTGVAEYGAKS